MSNITTLIPELKEPHIHDLLRANILLANLDNAKQMALVIIVLEKIGLFYQHFYFKLGNKEETSVHLPAWISGVSDLTIRNLFSGLLACLRGKTRYIDKPPPNVVAFCEVCRSVDSQFPADYFEPIQQLGYAPSQEALKKSDEIRRRSMEVAEQYLSRFRKGARAVG